MHVDDPRLRPQSLQARPYQEALARIAAAEPTLVVLPTGLGKTAVAVLTLLARLADEPQAKALILAPTKPLVEQHVRFLQDVLVDAEGVEAVTGDDAPAARVGVWRRARIVAATPQVVRNDLLRGSLAADTFSLLVFDEAHRAVGHYPYVAIAKRLGGHRMGLSASPGTDAATIRRVMRNLGLARAEVRTEKDADVRPFVHDVATEWVRVKPNAELVAMARGLQTGLTRSVLGLRRLGFLGRNTGAPSRKRLLELGNRLRLEAARGRAPSRVYDALSLQAKALKIEHALEMCETQGPGPLAAFLSRLATDATRPGAARATREWVESTEFQQVLEQATTAREPHPKVAKLVTIVEEQLQATGRRVLVFANFRETADALAKRLAEIPGARVERFVGHARTRSGQGLSKRAQQHVVDGFRSGQTNVLVATSVGEEGLDLPDCDAVVLFEPVASGIRMIQRRGRTGRRRDGRLFVLITEGTRDAAYFWSARRRERQMQSELRILRRTPAQPEPPKPVSTKAPAERGPEVVVDTREFQAPIVQRLVDEGFHVTARTLEAGDYLLPGGRLVERKTAQDLAASIVDGRFFAQIPKLAEHGAGMVLVEGSLDGAPRLPRAALIGALASAQVKHGVSVACFAEASAAGEFLLALARRGSAEPAPDAGEKRPRDAQTSDQAFLFQGLPGVGAVLGQRLVDTFGSMANLCQAAPDELARIEGVGRVRAQAIVEALHVPASAPMQVLSPQGLAQEGGDRAAGRHRDQTDAVGVEGL